MAIIMEKNNIFIILVVTAQRYEGVGSKQTFLNREDSQKGAGTVFSYSLLMIES